MTPTSKLRFVERESYSRNGEHFVEPHKVRILQQFWVPDNEPYEEWLKGGEWRDVPIEKEQS
jgi:hypothetical protein